MHFLSEYVAEFPLLSVNYKALNRLRVLRKVVKRIFANFKLVYGIRCLIYQKEKIQYCINISNNDCTVRMIINFICMFGKNHES